MAYDTKLADRIREYLSNFPKLRIEEKEMFKGIAFMINGKMCVNVSAENIMCRFDPVLQNGIAEKKRLFTNDHEGQRTKRLLLC